MSLPDLTLRNTKQFLVQGLHVVDWYILGVIDLFVVPLPFYLIVFTCDTCVKGDVSIAGGVTYDPSTQTLTCISTGGPATTVTWTRDSTTVTQGTQTVLNDPVTAQYTHTLTVMFAGEYTCTVANNKPSNAFSSITVAGMTQ